MEQDTERLKNRGQEEEEEAVGNDKAYPIRIQ